VKKRLQTCQDASFEELEANVVEILGWIAPTELTAAMRSWMARLKRLIKSNGEYA
jgi:hypothetical protein